MSVRRRAENILNKLALISGILIACATTALAAPETPADSSTGTPSASEYCLQKYGRELRSLVGFEYQDAHEFDPRCPTWPPLAIGIAAYGTSNDLRKMLEAGLSPDDTEFFRPRQMTLLDAAIRGNKIETVKLLLSAGASVKKGYPVLSVFRPLSTLDAEQSYAQRLELLDLVLSAGVDPDMPCQQDASDGGPLMVATSQADELSVERLLKAGAQPDGAMCPGVPNYNEIMLPLFFKPFSQVSEDSVTDAQRAYLKNDLPVYRETSPLETAIKGDWVSAQKITPKVLQMWHLEPSERLIRYRRIAVRLVENGAKAIGYSSFLSLRMGDDPKLVSIAVAAARKAGYEPELIARLEEDPVKLPQEKRIAAYLTMLKNCKNKVMEAKGDYFRLCASEE